MDMDFRRRHKGRGRRRWLRLGPLVSAMLAGCSPTSPWHVDNCATIPPGAIPAPSGTYVREAFGRQAEKAEQDDFTIYKHEWYKGGRDLGPYGEYHLGQIIKRLPTAPPFPVLLEVVSGAPELNEARRGLVVARLQAAGVPDPAQRVIL